MALNQIAARSPRALAAGLHHEHEAVGIQPSWALIFAEILTRAGVPKGCINLVTARPGSGAAMSEHTDSDMIRYGSTRAGSTLRNARQRRESA